ncbi:uncharacterized protein RHOBADRAFT_51360 [Rhodotorula graminis WP1]|uniref:Ima1 N-terminal domain-containing protein n=1 Tax=Rhodotorula graminis (strain WP1) TaxID=578459 RepID=A0A194SDN3_RHOGW|nr:uncharacterized protein RHOBADRAFT_51360 [Rhodotorula graminis WP1]KPV77516.1 hypothetical protein RHOBADRAFT_51360 [Rhodotorula graminis WP1]
MLFRRNKRVQCWYCSTRLHLLPPASARQQLAKGKGRAVDNPQHVDGPVAVGTRDEFWCGECGQITKHDQNGEVVSDDAAFFDPRLNDESFAKRGSPSRHRLPSSFATASTTPFCRLCLANQSLQLHLLASYPSDSELDPDDPDSDLSSFPPLDTYRESLDARYPLVCASCAPAVENSIRERDYRVKAQALGWRLRESQRAREREERVSEEKRRSDDWRWTVEGWAWRARGAAWVATGVGNVGLAGPYFADASVEHLNLRARHFIVPLALVSLLWSFWDPTWSRTRLERARGRSPSVQGRSLYLAVQMSAYLVRLVAAFAFQFRLLSTARASQLAVALVIITIAALASALYLPRLKPPTPIRLAPRPSPASGTSTPATSRFPLSPAADPLEPLAHLSLSRPGSLLAPSPPATPTSPRAGSPSAASSRAGTPRARTSSAPRARLPSLSLRPWRAAGGGAAAATAMDHDGDGAGDADSSMDWAPLPPVAPSAPASPFGQQQQQHVTFARQRFVPPDTRQPTGLEGMFERVVAVREAADERRDGEVERMQGVEMAKPASGSTWWRGWLGGK